MNYLKEASRLIILALRPECKSYDEAIKKEKKKAHYQGMNEWSYTYEPYPLTIGRVMKALPVEYGCRYDHDGLIIYHDDGIFTRICKWEQNDLGIELLSDQTQETQKAIYQLFKINHLIMEHIEEFDSDKNSKAYNSTDTTDKTETLKQSHYIVFYSLYLPEGVGSGWINDIVVEREHGSPLDIVSLQSRIEKKIIDKVHLPANAKVIITNIINQITI